MAISKVQIKKRIFVKQSRRKNIYYNGTNICSHFSEDQLNMIMKAISTLNIYLRMSGFRPYDG
ncbi:MAG: hypothetical protein PWQ71_1508 [Bacteroidota bacterium]|jgi:hypothetical protein|nr:hypothetical protein [Bacteroidota bacterium]